MALRLLKLLSVVSHKSLMTAVFLPAFAWGANLSPVTGNELLLKIQKEKNKITILNIWATWCGPCVEEMPDLLKIQKVYGKQGLNLMLVSADFPSEVQSVHKFLDDRKVTFPTYIKQGKDMEFISQLHKDWDGAIPVTFVFGKKGNLLKFFKGSVTFKQVENEFKKAKEKEH